MSKSQHPAVRALLRVHEDGLTAREIATELGLRPDSVRTALENMPDCYIDRWTRSGNAPFTAVWCAVQIPDDCPKPDAIQHETNR